MNLKGILFASVANLLFGTIYYFSILLLPLEGESIFGFRIVVVLPFILFALFIFKQRGQFIAILNRIKQKPLLALIIAINAMISGVQLWIFLWAGSHGYAIDVSIGYLLLPIMMAAIGRIFFNEKFSILKNIAIMIAFLGVLSNILISGSISWASLVVCLGYPTYWLLRKYYDLNYLATFFLELLFLLPFALYFIAQVDFATVFLQNSLLFIYLTCLGFISGSAFILYILASQSLPINLLGLLGYLEPMVMLIISFLIGEVLQPESYILMICLICSISLLVIEGIKRR